METEKAVRSFKKIESERSKMSVLKIVSESCYDRGGSRREVTSTMIGQLRVFGVHMTWTDGQKVTAPKVVVSWTKGEGATERTPRRLVAKQNPALASSLQQVASADSHVNTYDLVGKRRLSLCRISKEFGWS